MSVRRASSPRGRPRRTPVDWEARPDPRQGGPHDQWDVERASASPILKGATPPTSRKRQRQVAPHQRSVDGPLRSLQEWFAAVIMHPRSVQAGLRSAARAIGVDARSGSDRIVVSSAALSAQDRMGIYHFAYQARLVDCLADDFPCVAACARERGRSHALAHDVINALPVRSSQSQHLWAAPGPALPGWDDTRCPIAPSSAELAELEWSMMRGPARAGGAEPLAGRAARRSRRRAGVRGALRAQSRPARAAQRRIRSTATCRRTAMSAHRPSPLAKRARPRVYRKGFTVWRMDLTMPMCGDPRQRCARGRTARAGPGHARIDDPGG
jgi:hypothetical protein